MLDAIRAQPTMSAATTEDAGRRVAAEDAALVARAKQDRRAFAALYDRYLDRVYRFCYVRLGCHMARDD